MKKIFILCLSLAMCFCFGGCKKKGTLVLQAVKELPSEAAAALQASPPQYIPDNTTVMHTLDLRLTVTGIWVSQDVVRVGGTDNLTWYKIGENDELKLFEEYSFTAEKMPAGTYKSIKMVFKNQWYRIAAYQSDITSTIEMLDVMGNYPCDYTGEVPANYFSDGGNHVVGEGGTFVLASAGEKVSGFEIKPRKVTKLYWKLGGEADLDPTACTFDWVDANGNQSWDCGIDQATNFQCTQPSVMWGFIAEYE